MEDFIKALNIFLKYGNPKFPFHCEHDVLYIYVVEPSKVSEEDIESLEKLGFHVEEECDEDRFYSYKYGSC